MEQFKKTIKLIQILETIITYFKEERNRNDTTINKNLLFEALHSFIYLWRQKNVMINKINFYKNQLINDSYNEEDKEVIYRSIEIYENILKDFQEQLYESFKIIKPELKSKKRNLKWTKKSNGCYVLINNNIFELIDFNENKCSLRYNDNIVIDIAIKEIDGIKIQK
jgi:hypothetical protein